MPGQDDQQHVWDLMEKVGFCMLASLDGELIRSRPMAAYVRQAENAVFFLTDVESAKDDDVTERPQVNLAFADTSAQCYVSVTGMASVSNDRDKIRELFSVPAKAWWDSPEDPSIRLLRVTPIDAQYWDSPGKLRSYVRMAAAAVSDRRPELGDNEKVDMTAAT